jgi:dUTP pyrophosphatase
MNYGHVIFGTPYEPFVPTIKVKYLTDLDPYVEGKEGFYPLAAIKQGNWIDLRAAETMYFWQGEHKLIPLGVAMQLPDGYEGWVVPRSSTMKNYGIIQANHLAIIDNAYKGNGDQWFMSVIAMRSTTIPRGSRICQFRYMPIMGEVNFVTVDDLGNPDRSGFGSTGA